MTREYILQNLEVMCPIMFIDNPGLRDHVMITLQDSLLIPKPKFKVGDVVKTDNGAVLTIDLFENLDLEDGWIYQFYDPNDNKWRYLAFEGYEWSFHEEDWLELVEEGR